MDPIELDDEQVLEIYKNIFYKELCLMSRKMTPNIDEERSFLLNSYLSCRAGIPGEFMEDLRTYLLILK